MAAVPRKLTATIGVLLVLGVAGCGGKDEPSSTAAQQATATTDVATPATTTSGTKSSKSSKSLKSSTTGSKASTGSKTNSTAKKSSPTAEKSSPAGKTTSTGSASSKTTSTEKSTTTTPKTPVGVTPSTGADTSGSKDLSDGTGSGPAEERLQIVAVLRRYYKAFIDSDGDAACSLLTSAGREILIADAGAKTCSDSVARLVKQAGPENVALLERTRDGLHINDIRLTGNTAIAQIGKTSQLRLVRQNGRWLLRSPDVVDGT